MSSFIWIKGLIFVKLGMSPRISCPDCASAACTCSLDSNVNLPMLLAGGGFRHGQHLVFDAKDNTPFCNLFVQMLQKMNIEADHFGTSTAASLPGLV